MPEQCCNNVQLDWTQRIVDHRYADICFCASCGTVHSSERYRTPLRLYPLDDRCINCGGTHDPNDPQLLCDTCGRPPDVVQALHDRYAELHPSGSYLEAAFALFDMNRNALALKMASAEIAWGQDSITAGLLRLQLLAELGEIERALKEGYDWSRADPPMELFSQLAELELAAENPEGAIRCYENALAYDPGNPELNTDMAELMMLFDLRSQAAKAAATGLQSKDPAVVSKAASLLAEAGERYYANAGFAEALSVCSLAGPVQKSNEDLAWLRARICASQNQDNEQIMEWLRRVIALNPQHHDAKQMLETFKPPEKSGWFGF